MRPSSLEANLRRVLVLTDIKLLLVACTSGLSGWKCLGTRLGASLRVLPADINTAHQQHRTDMNACWCLPSCPLATGMCLLLIWLRCLVPAQLLDGLSLGLFPGLIGHGVGRVSGEDSIVCEGVDAYGPICTHPSYGWSATLSELHGSSTLWPLEALALGGRATNGRVKPSSSQASTASRQYAHGATT